uniref:Immunoglobulin V-set domain-containing protein n=1 Tax=Paramormyrops kingsleyae TaxID=1676925 RepID=A0A3B3SAT7_9TELE
SGPLILQLHTLLHCFGNYEQHNFCGSNPFRFQYCDPEFLSLSVKGHNIQYIYWYRQPQGQGLELIASIVTKGKPTFEPHFEKDKARYDIEKPDMVSGSFRFTEDAAVYFCAATEHNDMLLPHLHSKTDTLRCLMEKGPVRL